MTCRYIDGFQTYTSLAERYYSTNNASIVSAAGRDATLKALRLSTAGGTTAFVRRYLYPAPEGIDSATNAFVAGVAFKMSAINTNWPLAIVDGIGGNVHLNVDVDGTGHLRVKHNNSTVLATGATVLTTGVWYWIELKATIAASGSFELWLGATLEISGSGVNTRNGGAGLARVLQVGSSVNITGAGTWDFSDLFFFDQLDLNSTVRGDSKVITIFPASDGGVLEWIPVGPGGTEVTNLIRTPTSGTPTYSGTGTPSNAADGLISPTTSPGCGWTGASGSTWRVDFSVPQLINRVRVRNKFGDNLGHVVMTTDTGLSIDSGTIVSAQVFDYNLEPVTVSWILLTNTSGRSAPADLIEVEAYSVEDIPHWSNLDEVPSDEVLTRNVALAVGLHDTIVMSVLSLATNIGAIQIVLRCRRTDGGSHYMGFDGSDQALLPHPGAFTTLLAMSERDPGSSTQWKQADINGSEFGYQVVS